MPNLFIIAGCNGSGKTTASFTILPQMLNCREFVNADNIAAGLSPFKPESVAFEAGRIMLQRINALLQQGDDFAFETTLSTRSYVDLVKQAQNTGYRVSLLYFWLPSPEFAKQRVAERVSKGGHNIPADIIERRYYRGIHNLVNLYMPSVDDWRIISNAGLPSELICRGTRNEDEKIFNSELWNIIQRQSKHK